MTTFVNYTPAGTNGTSPLAGGNNPPSGSVGATLALMLGTSDNLLLQTNRVYLNSTGGATTYVVFSGVPGAADYSVFMTFLVVDLNGSGNGRPRPTVFGRFDTAGGNGYAGVWDGGETKLYRWDAGVFTMIDDQFSASHSPGDIVTVELRFTGSLIRLYDNGTLICSATDATYGAAGRVGFGLDGTSTSTTGQHVQSLTAVDSVAGAAPKFAPRGGNGGSYSRR